MHVHCHVQVSLGPFLGETLIGISQFIYHNVVLLEL